MLPEVPSPESRLGRMVPFSLRSRGLNFGVRDIIFNSLKRTDLPEFCLGSGNIIRARSMRKPWNFKNEFFLNQAPASFTLIFVKEALQFVLFGFVAFCIGFFFPGFDCGFEGFRFDHCKVFSSFERDIL